MVDAVVVQPVLERVVPVGDGLDLRAGEALGPREQLLDVAHHRGGAVRGEQLAQAGTAEPARRHLGHEVAGEHLRQAHVAGEQAEEILVQLAGAEELRGRDDDALLVELGGVGGHAARGPAAHVLVVAHRAGQRDGAAVGEDRHRERDVGQVGAAVVRVVQEKRVALVHAPRGERRSTMRCAANCSAPRWIGMAAAWAMVSPLRVEQRGRGVEALLDDRRGRALEQRQLHLVGDGVEPVAQDLEEDGVDGAVTGPSGAAGCRPGPPAR